MPEFDIDVALEGDYTVHASPLPSGSEGYEVRSNGVLIGLVWTRYQYADGFHWVVEKAVTLSGPKVAGRHYTVHLGRRQSKEEGINLLKNYHTDHPEAFHA